MNEPFGTLPTGQTAKIYYLSAGGITAAITDYGATLVRLLVPDSQGNLDDVVLGYDDANGYRQGSAFLGATVGRNANRIKGAAFCLNGRVYPITPNENGNNLHSGPDFYHTRLWTVKRCTGSEITFSLHSPSGDQGFPGNADIRVTYRLDSQAGLHILYEAVSDRDTIFNLTNHSYFNLAGHEKTELASRQLLSLPGRYFTPDDPENIPTGVLCLVSGTPMDFRVPKPIAQDIGADYEPLLLQGGYDHNWEVFCNPCATLFDPSSGRTMSISTDCPGIQFYSGNYLSETGKGGIHYGKHAGIALETQFYPDAIHNPQWRQPVVAAGTPYRSETIYRFTW